LGAALKISVCNGGNGKPCTDLTQNRFQVQTLADVATPVAVKVLKVTELAKEIPGSPAGIYELLLDTSGGFSPGTFYTFVIQVRWRGWFTTFQGQAIAGGDYWPRI
jgi:hypothetical protein